MTALVSENRSTVRAPRSSLDTMIMIGLLSIVAEFGLVQLGGIVPALLIFALIYLGCAGIVASGWRWSMVIPGIISPTIAIMDYHYGISAYALRHPLASPNATAEFVLYIIYFPVIMMITGICALKWVQTIRGETPHAPRWVTPALTGLGGIMLGALLIGLSAQPVAGAGNGTAVGAHTETVHVTDTRFAPDIVALHTGETLTVIADAKVQHILTNGTWSPNNRPLPGTEPGAPRINNVTIQGNTITLGPFTTSGTYHVYCTLHAGMVLTILVQ